MKQRERVAELRRALPKGAAIQDYVFLEGPTFLDEGDEPVRRDDIKERGIDEWNPIWNVLDLTPQGRGNWYASLDYGTKVQAARR